MEWLLMALAVGGGGTYGWTKWRASAADRAEQAADLEVVRRLADEDVTVLGEQLSRLDTRLAGARLDGDAQVDYQAALDAYERAGAGGAAPAEGSRGEHGDRHPVPRPPRDGVRGGTCRR